MNKEDILKRYSDYTYNLFKSTTDKEKIAKMRTKFTKEIAEINKNCRATLENTLVKVKQPQQNYISYF